MQASTRDMLLDITALHQKCRHEWRHEWHADVCQQAGQRLRVMQVHDGTDAKSRGLEAAPEAYLAVLAFRRHTEAVPKVLIRYFILHQQGLLIGLLMGVVVA